MLSSLIYIFAFVFVLSIVVVIHEGGHFYMARACGVHVTDFSVGFGKELWYRVDKKGTRWKICAIPLGGYCKMLGDEDVASAKSSTAHVEKDMMKYTFMAQPLWKRALIIVAGPGMNYLSAIVLLAGIIYTMGEAVMPPIIGHVMPDSPAAEAGLQVGDKFVKINNQDIVQYQDIQRTVRVTDFAKPLTIVFERAGEQKEVLLTPRVIDGSEFPLIGIRPTPELVVVNDNVGLLRSFGLAIRDVYSITVDTLTYLGQVLFEDRSAKDMRGPLGIAEASGDAMKGGVLSLLMFIVNISIAVGFMNLLPVPVLDGGHLVFYAIEAIRGKPLSEKTQNAFLMIGISLLLMLLVYTMFLDVPRITQRIVAWLG